VEEWTWVAPYKEVSTISSRKRYKLELYRSQRGTVAVIVEELKQLLWYCECLSIPNQIVVGPSGLFGNSRGDGDNRVVHLSSLTDSKSPSLASESEKRYNQSR
jgi:hypothetical protein